MNKIVLLLIAIVLLGIAGFSVLWFGFGFGVGADVQALAEQILVDCRDGKSQAVYEGATEDFRTRQSATQFQAYIDYWQNEMGAFEKLIERRSASTATAPQGVMKEIALEVAFEKGRVTVEMSFLDAEPTPLLEQIHLRRVVADVGETDRSGLEAVSRALMARYDASDFTGLYAALSSELQREWTQAKAEAQLTRLRSMLGAVKRMTLQSAEQAHGDVVIQYYTVEFEKAKGTAKVSFGWKAGRWRVLGFLLSPAS